jgi:hypothetical protein
MDGDDAGVVGRECAAERGAEVLDAVDRFVAAAEQRRGVREVEPVRRRDVLDVWRKRRP